MTKTILVLASNPRGTTVLDLSREIRDIEEGLKRLVIVETPIYRIFTPINKLILLNYKNQIFSTSLKM